MNKLYDTPRNVTVAFPGGVVYVFNLVVGVGEEADGSFRLVRLDGADIIINNTYDYIELGVM